MVAGINCISPMVPLPETAQGRSPDSCSITARFGIHLLGLGFGRIIDQQTGRGLGHRFTRRLGGWRWFRGCHP